MSVACYERPVTEPGVVRLRLGRLSPSLVFFNQATVASWQLLLSLVVTVKPPCTERRTNNVP